MTTALLAHARFSSLLAAALVLLASSSPLVHASAPVAAQLHRVVALDAGAVCNDGSPGAYYLQEATTEPNKWVMRLMGGGWCISAEDCAQRWQHTPYLMSTAQLPDSLAPGDTVAGVPDTLLPLHGILSADPAENPHWAGWNHVYVWYCSSDSHLGDAPAGSVPGLERWTFAGKRIVRAAVRDLLRSHGLAQARQVLVTGDSAGGVGAMNNAAFIRGFIRREGGRLQKLKVLVDAGWFLDIPSFSPQGWFTFQAAARQLQRGYNASFDRACEAHFGAEESWRCFHAQYAWPTVPVEAFYLEFLYDSANLNFDWGGPTDLEPLRAALAASLAAIPPVPSSVLSNLSARLSGLLARLGLQPAANAVPPPSAFAPACFLHQTIDSPSFLSLRISSDAVYPRLAAWFERGERSVQLDRRAGVQPPAACMDQASALGGSGLLSQARVTVAA